MTVREMSDQTVLSGSAGLAGVQWAIRGAAARRMLRGAVARMLPQGSQVGPLQLTRAKYKPNKKINAYYTFAVSGPGAASTRSVPMSVTWQALSDPVELAGTLSAQQLEVERHGLMSPFCALWQVVPRHDLLLQVWPLDPVFPNLARLSDPAHAANLLQSKGLLRSTGGTAPAESLTIEPVRYRPGERHVLRYRLGKGGETFYVKLYEEPADAGRAFRVANRVVDCLEKDGGSFHGARPVAWSEEEGVLIYPRIAGVPLSRQLHRSPRWFGRQLALTGAALFRLHNGPPDLMLELKENTIEKESKAIRRASEHIQSLLPEAGEQILHLLERAGQMYATLPQEAPTFTHSDFKADHLLIDGDTLTLIDFDTCAIADPALDVGKFLADLQWWFYQHHLAGVDEAQQEFLRGYHREGLAPRMARARLWEVLILMKITARRVLLYGKDWEGQTRDLIERASQRLNELAQEPF